MDRNSCMNKVLDLRNNIENYFPYTLFSDKIRESKGWILHTNIHRSQNRNKKEQNKVFRLKMVTLIIISTMISKQEAYTCTRSWKLTKQLKSLLPTTNLNYR